jgi:hypothetical protein
MKAELATAGACCFLLAFGHTAIGVRWIFPILNEARLPGTPFGPPAMTLSMLRFTWLVVSLVALGFGILLVTLAAAPDADPETLLLRWLAVFWLAATAMALWQIRRRPSNLVRLPVPLVFLLVAVLCWAAST